MRYPGNLPSIKKPGKTGFKKYYALCLAGALRLVFFKAPSIILLRFSRVGLPGTNSSFTKNAGTSLTPISSPSSKSLRTCHPYVLFTRSSRNFLFITPASLEYSFKLVVPRFRRRSKRILCISQNLPSWAAPRAASPAFWNAGEF